MGKWGFQLPEVGVSTPNLSRTTTVCMMMPRELKELSLDGPECAINGQISSLDFENFLRVMLPDPILGRGYSTSFPPPLLNHWLRLC